MTKMTMPTESTKPARTCETVQYIRDHKRNPIGVMIAKPIDGKLAIGFSLCCKRDKNRLDKDYGINKARERALLFIDKNYILISSEKPIYDMELELNAKKRSETVIIPQSVYHPLSNFIDKCEYKYDNCELPSWTDEMYEIV